jgi:hypothetical protein
MRKLDSRSVLMITILRERSKSKDHFERYLTTNARAIASIGQLFEYLGLATFDEKSPLGWKPTSLLMQIIGLQIGSITKPRSKLVYPHDQFILTVLHHAVYGCDYFSNQRNELAVGVLHALGLVNRDRDGAYGQTPLLVSLVAHGYRRRLKITSSQQSQAPATH